MSFIPEPARTTPAPTDTFPPCVLDIEASGFGRGSYPIEIGIVLPDGGAWCTLIRPQPEWLHWDAQAERTHGITRSLLQTHGRDPADVTAELNKRVAGREVYCDNWAHDFSWLSILFEAAHATPGFRLHHFREIVPESQMPAFVQARAAVIRRLHMPRHRASADARILQLSLAQALGIDAPPEPSRT